MGVITLLCMTANGTRIVGMSYTHSIKDGDDYKDNFVALVQSNDNPTSIDTMTWSLISAWPRDLYYPQDYSPMVCHVDPNTGVFTMMSAFNLTDPNYLPDPSAPQRPSGGFQYNPHTAIWSDFTLSDDYLWEDVTDSFAVFSWPGTNTLVQANVGTTTTVSLGVMTTTAKGTHQFVNALTWTLDPMTYGYPTRLVYGNNVLYQFGTVLANNRTGQLNTILTRIPLSGSLETFQPPAKLQTYNSSMQECAPGYLSTSFYDDVLYVFCQGTDRSIGPGTGVVMKFKDGAASRDKSLGPAHMTDIDRLSGAVIQPIGDGAGGKQNPFALVVNAAGLWSIQSISLGDSTLGDSSWSDYYINITAPYGDLLTDPPNHTPAIIGGSVAGALVVLAIILFFVLRKRWPGWRRKIQFKVLEAMMKDDHADGNSSDKDIINNNKFEEPSSSSSYNSLDLDSRGKILVTEDMEENAIDVSTGYMREVGLEHHPRPTITTSLGVTTGTTATGSESGYDGSIHGKAAADEILVRSQANNNNNRTMAYSSLSKSSPTTSPYGQDYELSVQLPRNPHSVTTSNASSAIWTESMPPLAKTHHHLPTAPFLYTRSDSSLAPINTVSPIPFRSTGSPPIPHSISSKEKEAWSQVHGSWDSAPPYNQIEHNHLTVTYPLPQTSSSASFPSSSSSSSSTTISRATPAPAGSTTTSTTAPAAAAATYHIPPPISLLPPAKLDHRPQQQQLQKHQLPQQEPITVPTPIPREPQAILQSSETSSSFPSLGLATGVSRRTRRSL